MKISIGTNIQDGPWGGGNLFVVNLKIFGGMTPNKKKRRFQILLIGLF